jgi:membrane protease YdiL (CAAX protease family)
VTVGEGRALRLRLLWLAGVVAPTAMVFVGFLLSWLVRRELPDLATLPDWRTALLGVGAAGASMGLVTLLYKSSKTFERALRESGTRVGEEALRLAGYPVMLVVVVMAGLGEEVLFRGGLQPIVGVLPAALLFGFSHGGWRREMWAYVVAASISGGLFGLLYQLTGNLWAPIIAHALHNLMSTLLLGKRVEVTRRGLWPVVRLVPDEPESTPAEEPPVGAAAVEEALVEEPPAEAASLEEAVAAWEDDPAAEWTAWNTQEEVAADEPVAEPVPAETDRPDDGDRDRPAADRPAE